jgi:hypothetical protein
MLDKELLDILACPVCKADIHYDKKENFLICKSCKRAYPVKDDIPIMLEEEAKVMNDYVFDK